MYYYCFLFIVILIYVFSFFGIYMLPQNDYFQYISMALFLIMSIWYLIRNRRDTLFCPEIILLFLGFLISFYKIIVLNNIGSVSSLFLQFSELMEQKSICLSLIGFDAFIIGEEIAKKNYLKNRINLKTVAFKIPTSFVVIMHLLSILAILLIFFTGRYIEFMKYTLEEGKDTNMIDIMLSVLFMVSSILEFQRLHKRYHNRMTFTSFLLHVNKIYVIAVVAWSLFLLLTGNRGEAMLIALPPIILYFFLIKRIKNMTVIFGAIVGSFAMVYVGLTRQGDSDFQESAVELGAFGVFRDYGAAYVNQQGLIQYTDAHGMYGLSVGFRTLVSSVPFLGGFLIGDSFSNKNEGKTNELTTEQWQLASNMDSGLGTNLLGDLYYAGGLFFVVIYMGILGWFLSYCYERLYNKKYLNAFSLFTYCWIFADCLYILRASYYHLFRQIGFSLVIYFFLYVLSNIGTDKSPKTKLNLIKHST